MCRLAEVLKDYEDTLDVDRVEQRGNTLFGFNKKGVVTLTATVHPRLFDPAVSEEDIK